MKPRKVKFDKMRPVFFGWAAVEKFEELTKIPFANMGEALSDMKADVLISFVYAGLYGGATKTKQPVDFTRDDVVNWLDDIESDKLGDIMNTYIACMPMAGGGASVVESKKK